MQECVQSYYLKDGKISDCQSFHTRLINSGTSIYEVARLSGTRLLFIEDHLERLFSSLEMEGIKPWLSRKDILGHLDALINKINIHEGNVKIVMNVGSDGNKHSLAYFVAHYYPSEENYINGVKVITFPFERPDPNKKIWRPVFRREVAEAIQKSGSFEALLLDSRGFLTEASKANIFAIQGDAIITPPKAVVLPGITRSYIINICNNLNIPVLYRKLDLNEIPSYDAMFLSGTSIKILPVSQVNDIKMPSINPILTQVSEQYDHIILDYLN